MEAEKSDRFDVLAYVAYALPPVTRAARAEQARVYINSNFNAKQQAFLDFVLVHYVNEGGEGAGAGPAATVVTVEVQQFDHRRG
jgi:type I restriction enzyme R subunit